MDVPSDCAPPPAYGAHVADLATDEDAAVLTASFAALDLAPGPQDPSVATCLAHLKLLFAFKGLRDDVGCHDGLWDIWDSRAHNSQNSADVLPLLREKRWAIFVARAVDRYESWWNTFPGGDTLTEADIHNGSSRYVKFTEPCEPLNLTPDELPPLGKIASQWVLSETHLLMGSRCSADLACTHAKSALVSGGRR